MPIHLHRSCRVAAATDQDPPERITPFDSNSKEHAHLKLDDKLLSQGVKQPDVVDRKEEVLRGMRGAQRMSFTLYETFLQMVSRPEEDWSDMHRILEELYGDRWETVFEELHIKAYYQHHCTFDKIYLPETPLRSPSQPAIYFASAVEPLPWTDPGDTIDKLLACVDPEQFCCIYQLRKNEPYTLVVTCTPEDDVHPGLAFCTENGCHIGLFPGLFKNGKSQPLEEIEIEELCSIKRWQAHLPCCIIHETDHARNNGNSLDVKMLKAHYPPGYVQKTSSHPLKEGGGVTCYGHDNCKALAKSCQRVLAIMNVDTWTLLNLRVYVLRRHPELTVDVDGFFDARKGAIPRYLLDTRFNKDRPSSNAGLETLPGYDARTDPGDRSYQTPLEEMRRRVRHLELMERKLKKRGGVVWKSRQEIREYKTVGSRGRVRVLCPWKDAHRE